MDTVIILLAVIALFAMGIGLVIWVVRAARHLGRAYWGWGTALGGLCLMLLAMALPSEDPLPVDAVLGIAGSLAVAIGIFIWIGRALLHKERRWLGWGTVLAGLLVFTMGLSLWIGRLYFSPDDSLLTPGTAIAQASPAATTTIVSFSPTPASTPTETPPPTNTPTGTPTPTPTPVPVGSATTEVNLRRGPGTDYDRVGALSVGELVEIRCRNNDGKWYQVKLPSGSVAWVAAAYIATETDVNLIPTAVPTARPTSTATKVPPQSTPTAAPPRQGWLCDYDQTGWIRLWTAAAMDATVKDAVGTCVGCCLDVVVYGEDLANGILFYWISVGSQSGWVDVDYLYWRKPRWATN